MSQETKETLTPLNLKWVTERIGKEYITEWRPGNAIAINAQTGTGKNHFIIHKLLSHAQSQQKQILYICNRVNLKRQFKKDIAEILGVPLNLEELNDVKSFDGITILSYQELENFIYFGGNLGQKFNKNDYGYVVFDECHYLIQDSVFNPKTNIILKPIIDFFKSSTIRIYMSATMYEIEKYILEIEGRVNKNNEIIRTFDYYYATGFDYSYITVKYFNDINQIAKLIKKDNSNDKWLLFVNNIEKGNHVNALLNEQEDNNFETGNQYHNLIHNIEKKQSVFVYAGEEALKDEKTKSELDSIINNGKFETKCLIATKVLDNGINFKDPSLKHIVVSTFDKTDLIQMIGRKRINIKNPEPVTVYIDSKNIKSFTAWLYTNLENKTSYINTFTKSQFEYDKEVLINKQAYLSVFNLIYAYKNERCVNELAKIKIANQIHFCNNVITTFKMEEYGEASFIKNQLKWLGFDINSFDKNNWVDALERNENWKKRQEEIKIAEKELFDILNDLYLNKGEIKKEEQGSFCSNIKEIISKIEGSSNTKISYGISNINKYLLQKALPFELKPDYTGVVFWEVVAPKEKEIPQNSNSDDTQKTFKIYLKRGDEIINTYEPQLEKKLDVHDINVNKVKSNVIKIKSINMNDIYWGEPRNLEITTRPDGTLVSQKIIYG